MPTGYAPRLLEYFNPSDGAADASGQASPGTDVGGNSPTASGAKSPRTLLPQTQGLLATPLAATASNAIVLENMKQGTPEDDWLIDAADSTIEGYAAEFTINHGQTVDFKINTDSKNYRIDIYRLGYYGGDGARKVATISKTLATAQIQPNPLFDPTLKLVDAGNWQVSASWAIPSDAVSGVYFAELTRLDGSRGQNIIPFIVRDDEAPSDVTFQTSDTTWQAYNWWGGYNFYGGIDDPGHAGRAYAVSYNRPIITRDGGYSAGPQDFVFGVEYPAIRWLEQNGYDVNYISGIDTARSASQLLNSKIFLSVGHDEYWSADQRDNVEAARDAGVNLAFWSGNEVYWETRWAPSIDGSGTPYKTLVSYKERWNNANIDTAGTTSTWRDPEFGSGEPENGLTGTIFTVDSYRLDTMEIPYSLSNFRFWSNTAVADIQPGQVYSLTPNLLGYEWDSDLDNGARPDGLIALSSTTVDVNTLLYDYGNTTGPGTASHSLTLYRAPSGALVFGAGTVYWSWGLDSHHDNEATPTDPNVQQAMVNLFADMGVQPQTLMQSLAVAQQTTDHTSPTTTITSPTSSGSFAAAQPITISGTAADTGGGTVAVVEVSTDGGSTWHRANGFANWTYNWTPLAGGSYTIRSRAVDDSVNLETPKAGTTITVAPAPTTSLFSPSDTPAILSDVDPNFPNLGMRFSSSQSGTIVGMKFYKGLGDGGTHVGTIWSSTGTKLGSATFSGETAGGWQTVTFVNPVQIAAGVTYVASYNSNGHYADTEGYFTGPKTNGPLTAPASNGYYTYAQGTAFPTTPTNGVNYWVDVIFSPTNTVNQPPVGVNDNGFVVTRDTPMTFQPATLLANDTDPNGDILTITGAGAASNGQVSFNAQTSVITFTPNPGYTGVASFGYSISDGRGGTGSAIVNMTVSPPVSGVSLFSSSDTPQNLTDSDAVGVNLGVRFTASTAGQITAVKYYKGANDTGAHTGSLWSSTGSLLATATFTNETTSGWQTVAFSNPVSITAGTTYVASFHSNGHYTSTANYFTTAHSNGPLTAAATNNGVYTYGSGNLFPSNSFGATNYWVDVVFSSGSGANQPPVATNDSGFTTVQNTALSITAASLLANDTDPNGDALTVTGVSAPTNGTVAFNAQTNTITFTPTAGFTGNGGFSYSISDGRGGAASAQVALSVTAPANQPPVATNDSGFTTVQNTALSITAASLLANDTDPNGDALTITGVSAPTNGTVAFNAQTNTVTFTPTAGFTGNSGFSYSISDGRGGAASAQVALSVTAPANQPPVATNDSGFTTVQNTALSIAAASLLANDTDPNGDALTITGVSAPTNGTVAFNAQTNTVTFTPTAGFTGNSGFSYSISDGRGGAASAQVALSVTAPANQPPVATNDSGFTTVQNTALSITATSLLANDTDPDGDVLSITGVSGFSNGTAVLNGSTITFTPTAGFTGNGGFSYSISDGRGGTASANVALSVTAPANQPPVATNDSGFTTVQNTALSITAASLLANDTDPNGDALTVTGVSAPTNGTVAFNAQTNTITFTPTAGFTGNGGFSYSISDGRGAAASANVALTVTSPPATQSLFAASATPSTITENDANSVELGMKFTASTGGVINGIRFYKGPQNTGAHTGSLWTSSGTLLGSLTFTNETASGWQSTNFANPISITAGTTYIVSYHSAGHYSANANYFSAAVSSGNLTALSSTASGGNGIYAYGSGSTFPTSSYNASNYWVDVVYTPAGALPNQPPVAANDSGFTTQQNTVLNIAADSLLANDTDPNGDALTITGVSAPTSGTVAFNAQTNTIAFTPTSGFTGNGGFTYSISDGRGGSASANVALTVTAPSATQRLFAASSTPATVNVNDTSPIELGMKFSASTGGSVTGVSFYKGSQNTGAHTGSLWSSTGTRLATATFTNETASGWQTVNFSSAVPITAGTTYVISYHTSGHYSANSNYFTNSVTNGPLTAPSNASSGGNGVYAYGSASAFPTSSYNSSNYWVDVLFNGQLAA